MGTAFLLADESGTTNTQRDTLIKATRDPEVTTKLTRAYSGKFARGIENDFMKCIEQGVPKIPPYPLTHFLSSSIRKAASEQNRSDIASMWCGENLPMIRNNISAAELIRELKFDCESALNQV